MSESEKHLRAKILLGALVVAVAMCAWVLAINIAARRSPDRTALAGRRWPLRVERARRS